MTDRKNALQKGGILPIMWFWEEVSWQSSRNGNAEATCITRVELATLASLCVIRIIPIREARNRPEDEVLWL